MDEDFSTIELEALYRALARRCHPDWRTSTAQRTELEGVMVAVNLAFERRDLQSLRSIARSLEQGSPVAATMPTRNAPEASTVRHEPKPAANTPPEAPWESEAPLRRPAAPATRSNLYRGRDIGVRLFRDASSGQMIVSIALRNLNGVVVINRTEEEERFGTGVILGYPPLFEHRVTIRADDDPRDLLRWFKNDDKGMTHILASSIDVRAPRRTDGILELIARRMGGRP